MRYTTLLDLREWPSLYANHNIRLVYLHLVLVAGYHDHNRDLTNISIRRLSEETGITISAVRNALEQLEKVRLIKRKKGVTFVVKYLKEQPITPRTTKSQGSIDAHEAPSTRSGNAITREEYLRRKKEKQEP